METIYTFYHFKMKGVENVLLTSSTNIQWQFNSEATNKVGIKCLVTDRPKNHMLCFFKKKKNHMLWHGPSYFTVCILVDLFWSILLCSITFFVIILLCLDLVLVFLVVFPIFLTVKNNFIDFQVKSNTEEIWPLQ